MRILHVCLSAFYIEGYAYQENILPRIHKKLGNEVRILASTETYVDNAKLGYTNPCQYVNTDGIQVTRIAYSSFIPLKIASKIRSYVGVNDYLNEYKPEYIFLHDVQFYNILDFVNYKKRNQNVIIVADGHTDYKNSAKNFVSKRILHGFYYKSLITKSERYISKFYGTLPSRNIFFREMYGIPSEKIEYLPMGIDDEKRNQIEKDFDRESFRRRLGVSDDDILLISGGKVTNQKIGIIYLAKILPELPANVKLLLFGSLDDEMMKEYDNIPDKSKIINVGWLNEEESIRNMLAADIAVFPCLHSTLWEQAAGTGLPCILYKMENFTHINVNNNCIFVEDISADCISDATREAINRFDQITTNAKEAKSFFSYSQIGERIIKENLNK